MIDRERKLRLMREWYHRTKAPKPAVRPEPGWWRRARHLSAAEGFTHREIATELGKSIQAVRYALIPSKRAAAARYNAKLRTAE